MNEPGGTGQPSDWTPSARDPEVEAALERLFFPHLATLGFKRDDRQPRLTCFRREAAGVMQIVAVLRPNHGRRRLVVQFTVAPLTGIDCGGKWLAAPDIYPGNLALLRGWLRPKPGSMGFATAPPWWGRRPSKQHDEPERVAGQLMAMFPEIVAWWETQCVGPHLTILPPVTLPCAPDHQPVFGCRVHPSLLQKFFAGNGVWTAGFFGIAVCTALMFALQASPDWAQMAVLTFAGATLGAMVSWLFLGALWRLRVWINGGPFHKGDLVQVIGGQHSGRIAAVYEEWASRSQVRIDLGADLCREIKDVFSFVQLCRVEPAEPDPASRVSPNDAPNEGLHR